jgi:hypothetical protein
VALVNNPITKGLFAGLALVLGSATAHADPAEDKAVQAVMKWGGRITREKEGEGRPVVGVELGMSQKVTDAGLKELNHFKSLRTLNLWNANNITDAGMKELKEFKSLRELNLWNLRVSDAGLADLKEIKNLEYLFLGGAGVTDAGLNELKEFKSLHTLDLSSTSVTDAGLGELKNCKELQTLYLRETKVTEAGVKELKTSLPRYNLPVLRAMKNLKTINGKPAAEALGK